MLVTDPQFLTPLVLERAVEVMELTVNVNLAPPAAAVFGERLFNVGAGGACALAAGADSHQMMIVMNADLAARRRTTDSLQTSCSPLAAHAASDGSGRT